MKAFLSKVTPIDKTHAAAVVHVTHAQGEDIRDNVAAAIAEATNREFLSVSGSTVVLDTGRTETFLRTILSQTKDVKPAEEAVHMKALSANMYMDESENLWSMKTSAGNDILVRSSDMNNAEELLDMISSCSSTGSATLQSKYPSIHKKLNVHMAELATAKGGDMASFVSESKVVVGFVAAQVQDGNDFSYLMVDQEGTQYSVSSEQFVAVLDGDQITEFPDMNVSLSASVDVEKLCSYYEQVFKYSPEYFQRLEGIIRNHAFN